MDTDFSDLEPIDSIFTNELSVEYIHYANNVITGCYAIVAADTLAIKVK